MTSEVMSLPISGEALMRQPLERARDQPELRELTASIRGGDEAAFTRLYDLYSLRLYKYLLVLARGNEAEAREVLQTVVVKLAGKMEIFEEERKLWAWMCRLARNAFVDRCRWRRRNSRFVSLEELPIDPVDATGVEDRLSICLVQALAALPAEESELLRAAYIDERPLQELADDAGQTYKAIESRLGRLRQKLKTALLTRLRHEKDL